MAFQLSPGINVSEIDLTNAVPAVATSEGAFVGTFRWGPTNERVLLSSEVDLVSRFGKPYTKGGTTPWSNCESFFSAANFLAYSDALYVTRIDDEDAYVARSTDSDDATSVDPVGDFRAKYRGELGNSLEVIVCDSTGYSNATGAPATGLNPARVRLTQGSTAAVFVAEPVISSTTVIDFDPTDSSEVNSDGTITTSTAHGLSTGDMVQYSINHDAGSDDIEIGGLDAGTNYFVVDLTDTTFKLAATYADATATVPVTISFTGTLVNMGEHHRLTLQTNTTNQSGFFEVGGIIEVDNALTGQVDEFKILSGTYTTADNLYTATLDKKFYGTNTGDAGIAYKYFWKGSSIFDAAPESNRLHVAILDKDGQFSATSGTVLESYENVSLAQGTKYFDGSSSFLGDLLGDSNYADVAVGDTNVALNLTPTDDQIVTATGAISVPDVGRKSEIMSLGADGAAENAELGAIMKGWDLYKSAEDVDVSLLITGPANSTVANYVMDNIAEYRKDCVAFVSPQLSDDTAQEIVDFAALLSGSSYSVMDSGYKYQYDKYNDVYRWVPLNADIAGSCARTDDERDPWFSPAGFSRGQIKNVVKLKLNPNKTQRDLLYKNNVNPVIIEPGSGAILFGDKTMQKNPSAFDRINVRRLFIVLEKAIAAASKSTLFEFNDEFTRATFRNMIEPFLRDVQGRRGIYDFKVVCDDTNNTGEVVDTNRFIGDIYVKPARSINFIQLNFVAVRTGVEFNEIIGQ